MLRTYYHWIWPHHWLHIPTKFVPRTRYALFKVPVAYLGALAIGAVRPFGRRSEWLLLLFSPWMFVTNGPLSLTAFQNLRNAGALDTVAGLTPPVLFSVPALFGFTLFFIGQVAHWQRARAAGRSAWEAFATQLILPSLPLVAGAAVVLLLAGMQESQWPLIAATRPELSPVSVALVQLTTNFATTRAAIDAAINTFTRPVFIFFFILFGGLQVFYLERLSLDSDRGNAPAKSD